MGHFNFRKHCPKQLTESAIASAAVCLQNMSCAIFARQRGVTRVSCVRLNRLLTLWRSKTRPVFAGNTLF